MDFVKKQKQICRKYNADYIATNLNLKLGISQDFFSGELPLSGLRHPAEVGTCGWFLWVGEEMSEADDYFQPLHIIHLVEKFPSVMKYLGLPYGWRFLTANDYEDVWFDEKLLLIND